MWLRFPLRLGSVALKVLVSRFRGLFVKCSVCVVACLDVSVWLLLPGTFPFFALFAAPIFFAAYVYIVYPFRANVRSCGMCVSCIAAICALCLWSSCIMSFCFVWVGMLSGFRLIIVGVFRPAWSAMVVFRGYCSLKSRFLAFLRLLLLFCRLVLPMCHFLHVFLPCAFCSVLFMFSRIAVMCAMRVLFLLVLGVVWSLECALCVFLLGRPGDFY